MVKVVGISGVKNVAPGSLSGSGAPPSSAKGEIGQSYFDNDTSPPTQYIWNGSTWAKGGNLNATTTEAGIVLLNEDGTLAGADNSDVPTSLAVKTYVDATTTAGAPDASETVKGIAELANTAEATGNTDDERIMTSLKVAQVLASPPAIGGTSAGAGSFTTLAATGAIDFDAGGSFESGGATIDIGADASADAINVGTGAAARVITIGNVTGASQLVLNSGTAGIQLASTGTGDISIDSDDTLLLDADGVLELNSSAGVISIGNDADANDINVGTGAAARTITIGNSTGATQIDLESGTGPINVGTNAIAHSVSLGNTTGATAIAMSVGTGNFDLDGVGASTYAIGASTTTGTIDIGGTSQTGTFTLGGSDGAMTMNIANPDGTKTINVGNGVDGNTISIGNGANTSAQTINLANGASGADSTVNILSGVGTAGTQTLNVLGGTRAGALNLATGAAAHVIAIGSASAGAVTVDTAAGISLDSATASNFTVTGAADLTLDSSAGSVNIAGGEAVADAVSIQASAGGVDLDGALQVNIASSQAAADAIRIDASDASGGIDIDDGGGGTTIDSAGAISLDAAAASNFNVTGATNDLTLGSAGGRVIVDAGEDAADAIYLHANAGTSEKIRIHADQGTGADSIELESDDGGITLTSTARANDASIVLNSVAGGIDADAALQINIASSEAAADAIVINASDASGGIDIQTGGGSIDLSSSGFVTMAPATTSSAGAGATINADVGSATFTGFTTGSGAQQTFTITNSQVSATSALFVTVTNVGSNDARMTLERVKPAAGSFEVMTQNNGAAALNGDVILNFWRIA